MSFPLRGGHMREVASHKEFKDPLHIFLCKEVRSEIVFFIYLEGFLEKRGLTYDLLIR